MNKRFKKIVQIDACGLVGPFKKKIFELSEEPPVLFEDIPHNDQEIRQRIGDADCVLVSWNTPICAEVIKSLPNLKYIGMCCSLYDEASANVDIAQARKQGIIVKGIRDYGDVGTVEFIFAELIGLMKGLGKHQWKNEPVELTEKTIGIIGMGVLGMMVARTAFHFGMKVIYYSRSRKDMIEQEGAVYVSLEQLLKESDVVTTHLPRNTVVIDDANIGLLKKDAIYINTSLGQPFETEVLLRWLKGNSGNYAIFDAAGKGYHIELFEVLTNVIYIDKSSGFTFEAKERLTEKVWSNMIAEL